MKLFFFAAALLFVTVSGAKAQDQATVVASCGTAHYTAGQQAFRTVNVNGVTCSGAGTSSVVSSVWSATDAAANGMTLSNGGLTVASTTATRQTIRGSISKTSGKLYIEFSTSTSTSTEMFAGATSVAILASYLGSTPFSVGFWSSGATLVSGFTELFNATAYAPVAGDVMAVAIDFTAGKVWLAVNNVWENSGNPTAGTGMLATFAPATVGTLFPGLTLNDSTSGTWTLQPTAASQKYAPPAGFTAWDH